MFRNNECAVSPVIGVILMVAITVILAAAIAALSFVFGATNSKGPTAVITVSSVTETIGIADMKIQHKGGDRLISGDWKLSIVPVGQPPAYIASSSDFVAGDQIITTNVTDYPGATYTVTNTSVNIAFGDNPAARLSFGQKYDVKIILYPFETMVLDTVVEIR
jgi:flagellin-like protein